MRRVDMWLIVFVVLLVLVLIAWGIVGSGVIEKEKPGLQPVTSEVNIQTDIVYNNFIAGIDFGSLSGAQLPFNDKDAIENTAGAGGITTLHIERLPASTVNLGICVSANGDLISGINSIPLAGETYTPELENPNPAGPPGTQVLDLTPTLRGTLTPAQNDIYFRFWLDVPQEPAGTYQNLVTFTVDNIANPC